MFECAIKILLIFHLLVNFPTYSNGLLKSKDGILVPPQVYLFQAPRSAWTISQAPLNIKVEAFLRLNKINYTSVSSMLFLGSSTDGTVPYAEMNGKKLIAQDATQKNKKSEGSNAIIQQVAEYFKLSWPKGEISKNGNTEEKKLRRQIDYDLFNTVVMYTRSSTYYQDAHTGELKPIPTVTFKAPTPTMSLNLTTLKLEYSENGKTMPVKTGLDFMIEDASVRELMFSLLVDLAKPEQKTLHGVVLTRKLVDQYYDAKHDETDNDKAKQELLKTGGWTAKKKTDGTEISWADVDTGMQRMCTIFLINRLILAESGAMDNAKQYLAKNKLDGQNLSAYKEEKIVAKVQKIFGEISKRLELEDMKDGKKRLYLFGDERTPADCSLFGLLTVFFGIPLTVPPMVEYMQAVKNSAHAHHILVEYFEQMKKEVGMDKHWTEMTKRPWPLNFDDDNKLAFEEQMKDTVWDAAKRAMVPPAANSLLEIGNEH